jgi:hypothetical protein
MPSPELCSGLTIRAGSKPPAYADWSYGAAARFTRYTTEETSRRSRGGAPVPMAMLRRVRYDCRVTVEAK